MSLTKLGITLALLGIVSFANAQSYRLMYPIPGGLAMDKPGNPGETGENPGDGPGPRTLRFVQSSSEVFAGDSHDFDIQYEVSAGNAVLKTGDFDLALAPPGMTVVRDTCSNRSFNKAAVCDITFRWTPPALNGIPVQSHSAVGYLPFSSAELTDKATSVINPLAVNPLSSGIYIAAAPSGYVEIPANQPYRNTDLRDFFERENAAKLSFSDIELSNNGQGLPWGLTLEDGVISGVPISPGQDTTMQLFAYYKGNSVVKTFGFRVGY